MSYISVVLSGAEFLTAADGAERGLARSNRGVAAMVQMDDGSLRLYLQNIEEYVMDEDKIVS